MRVADEWRDYELIDTSEGERLERWGSAILIRPDPQIIWRNTEPSPLWNSSNARYIRSSSGGGSWERRVGTSNIFTLPESWEIGYKNLRFKVKPTGFKHTGLFPEQAVNWDLCADLIKNAEKPVKVLNLFAYTGGATLACAEAGAEVCHLDAVKNMVEWAKHNASLSGLPDRKIRWITDDAMKFIAREKRRGSRYDAIILDPPSYGRGTNGEMWRLEDSIHDLMLGCTGILSDKPLFVLLNSYTTGLSPSVMAYLLKMTVGRRYKVEITAEEIGLPVTATGLAIPCGNTAVAVF
ncbi:MAG: class I SAM-dependent methyltransferase [Oscillospiraceae bacterium]|jgi:23S rRNA (cytosine1962-C5)-methyltransferase|nr:class I SAM-dependent methyltransferase [Oscillospiraceae bacterium]